MAYTPDLGPYDMLFKIGPKLERLPIDRIPVANALGELIVRDGRKLEAAAGEEDFMGLEATLVGDIKAFRSGQSYGNVALNEVGDRFLAILEYVALIDRKFNTDPRKVERIRLAVIRAFREKVGTGAFRFIPPVYKDLYKQVDKQLELAARR
mgnify:FL=1